MLSINGVSYRDPAETTQRVRRALAGLSDGGSLVFGPGDYLIDAQEFSAGARGLWLSKWRAPIVISGAGSSRTRLIANYSAGSYDGNWSPQDGGAGRGVLLRLGPETRPWSDGWRDALDTPGDVRTITGTLAEGATSFTFSGGTKTGRGYILIGDDLRCYHATDAAANYRSRMELAYASWTGNTVTIIAWANKGAGAAFVSGKNGSGKFAGTPFVGREYLTGNAPKVWFIDAYVSAGLTISGISFEGRAVQETAYDADSYLSAGLFVGMVDRIIMEDVKFGHFRGYGVALACCRDAEVRGVQGYNCISDVGGSGTVFMTAASRGIDVFDLEFGLPTKVDASKGRHAIDYAYGSLDCYCYKVRSRVNSFGTLCVEAGHGQNGKRLGAYNCVTLMGIMAAGNSLHLLGDQDTRIYNCESTDSRGSSIMVGPNSSNVEIRNCKAERLRFDSTRRSGALGGTYHGPLGGIAVHDSEFIMPSGLGFDTVDLKLNGVDNARAGWPTGLTLTGVILETNNPSRLAWPWSADAVAASTISVTGGRIQNAPGVNKHVVSIQAAEPGRGMSFTMLNVAMRNHGTAQAIRLKSGGSASLVSYLGCTVDGGVAITDSDILSTPDAQTE